MISDSISALSLGWSKWQCYRIKHTVRLQLVNNSESSTVILRRRSHATPNYMPRKNDDNAAWFKRYSGNVFIVNSRCDLVSIINLFVSTNDVSCCIVSTKLDGFNCNYIPRENLIYKLYKRLFNLSCFLYILLLLHYFHFFL